MQFSPRFVCSIIESVVLAIGLSVGPVASAAATTIYWTQNSGGFGAGKLYRAPDTDPSSGQLLASASGSNTFSVLAHDAAGGTVYWAGDALERSDLDGGNRELMASTPPFSEGLAVDATNGVIYRANWNGTIQRSDLDGGNPQTILTLSQSIYGLALDQIAGKLYFTADDTFIYRSDLDGGNVAPLVDGGLEPLGITLDIPGGKMYWADWDAGQVSRANLDGSGVELLHSSPGNPIGVAIDPVSGLLYWSEWGTNQIHRSNLDGSQAELWSQRSETPWGLLVVIPEPSTGFLFLFGLGLLARRGIAA